MLNPFVATSGLLLLVVAPAARPDAPLPDGWQDVHIRERVVIRVPRISSARSRMGFADAPVMARAPMTYVERKMRKCLKMKHIAGATVTESDSVDFVLDDGSRVRAKLGADCPALGFYSGMYIRPSKDGELCAERDAIRTRSGRECKVGQFRALVPAR
ncbi:MAG: hypothetical protein ACOY45_16695 [Pseudomonadota bacterium]